MKILGIDPGYGITGFGLIETERGQFRLLNCGAITTPAGMDFSARLEIIYEDMRELCVWPNPMWWPSRSCFSVRM
jgi:crossover junction endodeoxyribonuclease RuvC